MNISEIKNHSIVVNPLAVIDRIIAGLELTETQYDDATESYNAVATVLQNVNPQLRPSIFPQGSMRLGTTVRPIKGERFDLDMVCWLFVSGKTNTPDRVYNYVWEILGQNETYRQMRVKKKRCIRLEYAPERKFYLDITPAVPDWAQSEMLYVPDRELKVWCSSHPKAFCDEFFKKAAEVLPNIRPDVLIANARSAGFLNASAHVELMPEFGAFEKTPLQRIVQMLKRDRDVWFRNDADYRPSSILLTTIITHSYSSLVQQAFGDLLDFVVRVVEMLPGFISVSGEPGKRKFQVTNPVNQQENFAESWTEEHSSRFLAWHKRVTAGLQNLQRARGRGNDVMFKGLFESFGEDEVVKAAKSFGVDTGSLHDAGKLRVTGGIAGTVGAVIPPTKYFGSEK